MLPQRKKIKPFSPKVVKTKGLKKAPLQMGHGFYNTSNRPLTIAKRNGVKYIVPPTPGVDHQEPGLLVNYSVSATPGVKIDLTTILTEEEESYFKEERLVIKEAASKLIDKGNRDYFSTEVNYFIGLATLAELQSVYLPHMDVVVSILDPHEIPEHPFSEVGSIERESDESQHTGTSINMLLIDNSGKCPERCYVNFYGITCLVSPVVSFTLADGLYVNCGFMPDDYNEMSDGRKNIFLRLEDLKKPEASIGLFATYNEAISSSNLERSRQLLERELEQLKLSRQLEIEKFKKEADEQKAKHEKEIRALAEEQARMEHNRKQTEHSLSLVSMERKDHYEHASVQRKGFLETLKTWAPALAGLAVIVAKTAMG